ncbi:MAG: prepilin-type N-terminal cleavage/methylation domain-containing protein, partial [Deltaproteobacteria bacterium]|nr:prepilin-type N-terminal cleavage/methylation domain-containing protein [Deltaproteobacteria bacterium]
MIRSWRGFQVSNRGFTLIEILVAIS